MLIPIRLHLLRGEQARCGYHEAHVRQAHRADVPPGEGSILDCCAWCSHPDMARIRCDIRRPGVLMALLP